MTARLQLAALSLCALVACGDDAPPTQSTPDTGSQDAAGDAAPDVTRDVEPQRDIPDAWDVTAPEPDAQIDAPADAPPDAAMWSQEPLAAQNDWGPAGRVVRLEMPGGPAEARSEGCLVFGSKVGTGLNSLLVLAGGLDQFLMPNAEGMIDVLLYARAVGWEAGQTPEELAAVDLEMYFGHPDPSDGWFISRRSFPEENPEAGPLLQYPNSVVNDGWLSGSPGPFLVDLNVLGLGIHLQFTYARLGGRLQADGPGFSLRRGVLTGYISQAGALALIHGIRDTCAVEGAPDICGAVTNLIDLEQPDEELVTVAGNFIGGYDAYVEDGVPSDCGDRECNAVSVCMLLDVDGVELAGILPDE